MLLAIDVGNSNIVAGLYDGERLVNNFRLVTVTERSRDELGIVFLQLFKANDIQIDAIDAVIISSVVPQIMYSLEGAIRKYIKKDPIIINHTTELGIKIKVDNPGQLGADRIVNAVAAYRKYGGPVIIVDFGTATTFCVIDAVGTYLGGAICPGIKISMNALVEHTAQLPRIELAKPPAAISANTVQAMQSGAVYGFAGQVDNIVARLHAEIDSSHCTVVATGGLARLIAPESAAIDVVDKYLTLDGLRMLYATGLS